MIDCFYCTVGGSPLRKAMGEVTLERLAELDVRVIRLSNGGASGVRLACSNQEFQVARRVAAEQMATSPIYLVADDDCLLMEEDWVERGLSVLDKYHDVAQLSGIPTNATIQPWTPEDYSPLQTPDFSEHVSICGTYFQRKGLMTTFPELSEHSYSRTQGEWFREKGYRVGHTPQLHFNHLGEGFGTWRV